MTLTQLFLLLCLVFAIPVAMASNIVWRIFWREYRMYRVHSAIAREYRHKALMETKRQMLAYRP